MRSFTKNTGSYIEGTEQIGDLAVGPLFRQPIDLDGKIWWEGPIEYDEFNSYCIIAKDAENKGTPDGSIGSVRFWGTGSTDAAFIGAVNRISNQNFTTTGSCNSWLSSNGYWTNCGVSFNPSTYPTHSVVNVYQKSGGDLGASEMYYSSTEDVIIVNTLYKSTSDPKGNAIIDVSTLSSGSTYNITTYLPTSGSLSFPANSGTGVIDQTNNKYYNYDNTSGEGHITEYDLSNNTISDYKTYTLGTTWKGLAYDSFTEKLIGYNPTGYLRIFNTNPLSLSASIDLRSNGGADPTVNGLICNNKGQVMVQRESRYWIIDINSKQILANSSLGSGTGYSARMKGAYCPTTDRFYINSAGLKLTIIEGANPFFYNAWSARTITLETTTTFNSGISVAYDPKRDTIWTFDGQSRLCAIDVRNDNILKRSTFTFDDRYIEPYKYPVTGGTYGGDAIVAGDLLVLSTGNPNNSTPVLTFDLNEIWPT